jgi:hypothetical protein
MSEGIGPKDTEDGGLKLPAAVHLVDQVRARSNKKNLLNCFKISLDILFLTQLSLKSSIIHSF